MRAWKAAGFAVVVALAGCSWGDDDEGTPAAKPIVPPLTAVSRVLPAEAFGSAIGEPSGEACFEITPSNEVRECSAHAQRAFAEEDQGRPRAGALVRVVAELRLDRPEGLSPRASLVVFRSRGLGTCFATVMEPQTAQLGCEGTRRCPAVCLGAPSEERDDTLLGTGPRTGTYLLLAGTVPAETEEVRLSFEGGSTRLYAVTGPRVPGLRDRRVFMADLGRGSPPARVELLAGGEVTESVGWRRMVAGTR